MSASNWSVCPRCRHRYEATTERANEEVRIQYGRVPVEQYEQLKREAAALSAPFCETEFREDYEIYGAEDGVVKVKYSGACGVCGLSLTFEHEHKIEGIDE